MFRVRVKEATGTGYRTLRVVAADEASARDEVGERIGDDWKILEVIPV